MISYFNAISKRTLSLMSFLPFLLAVNTTLTSCSSKVSEGKDTAIPSEVAKSDCTGTECASCSLPWGGMLPNGQTIKNVYKKELADCNESCDSFVTNISCKGGKLGTLDSTTSTFTALTGSVFQACYKKKCDCTQGGTVVADGSQKIFYQAAAVACDATCTSRNFQCTSGRLLDAANPSGTSTISSFPVSSCTAATCLNCTTPWGTTLAHKAVVAAYAASPACGTNCPNVTLRCTNGIISGGDISIYKFDTCQKRDCQNCSLPSGDIISHGQTNIKIYTASTSTCTTSCDLMSKLVSCSDGVITGANTATYRFATCGAPVCRTCTLPCGGTIASGGFGYCFSGTKPSTCGDSCLGVRKRFNCIDGSLVDEGNIPSSDPSNSAYINPFCTDANGCSSCPVPGGPSILDGTKKTFFKYSQVSCGRSCLTAENAVTLTCSNGKFTNQALYPDFIYSDCTNPCNTTTPDDLGAGRIAGEGGGAPRTLCDLPWNTGVATHNTKLVAFSRMSVPCGDKCSNYKATITCNGFKGLWTGGGTYVYQTCLEKKCN